MFWQKKQKIGNPYTQFEMFGIKKKVFINSLDVCLHVRFEKIQKFRKTIEIGIN